MSNFYITTPIYYVNSEPTIGHAYTSISCDILARYNKLNGKEVYYLSGTDEHGAKIQKAANEVSENPKEFTDRISKKFLELIKFLNCEINDFIRTTEKRHIISVQNLWNTLVKNNHIYLGTYEGWYAIRDECYYQENELIKKNDKYFAPSGAECEWIKEDSHFFKLSEWQDKLLEYYAANPDAIAPKSRYNEVISFISSGLKDLSVSRKTVKWGIPVPNCEGFTIFVWLDALQNYLSALGYPNLNNDLYKKFWNSSHHIVGKDILRFHAVYWPAFLFAAGLQPPKKIFSHGWWTRDSTKISKSLGNTIDPYKLVNNYGLDQLRYFLFREVPFGQDGDFSEEALITRVNADLSNNFGNLVQRICSFINKNCDSVVENNFDRLNDQDQQLLKLSLEKFENYKLFFEKQEIDKSIIQVMNLLREANVYCDKSAPWVLKKTNPKRMNDVLSLLVDIIRRSSLMLFPIIPDSVKKIYSILNLDEVEINFDYFDKLQRSSHKIKTATPVFPRIDNIN